VSDYATHLSPDRKVDLLGILEDLAADGLIGHKQKSELLEHPLRRASDRKRHPLIVISERGWVDQRSPSHKLHLEYLVEWLARRSGLPYHRINPRHMDMTRITTVIPYAYAARTNILPVKIDKDEIVIATDEPYSREWERELTPIFKQKITRVLANPNDIRRHLIELYTLARAVTHNLQNVNRAAPGSLQNLEHLMELGRAGELQADDQAVVSIVDWLLQYAFDSRASDIHLEPRRDLSNIRFRIDGVMHDVYQLPAAVMTTAISRLKILARMDLAEKRRPQDGRIKTRSPEGREVEMRVSSMPTAFGEKLVMRVFDPGMVIKDFCELGFADDDGRRWEKMIQQPSGIVVVTGPTGSGKTTTLYSSLKQLAVPEVNVCTIEDPIELVEPLFNQMQVQPSIDLTFADGVRALLRQDPDIIMIGEIRDLETAETAMQAAMTGHLVLSTMHTNDALSTITRLLDLGGTRLYDQGQPGGSCRATPGPQALSALPRAGGCRNSDLEPGVRRLEAAEARTRLRGSRMSGMPRHRLSRQDGGLRNHADERKAAHAPHRPRGPRPAARSRDE